MGCHWGTDALATGFTHTSLDACATQSVTQFLKTKSHQESVDQLAGHRLCRSIQEHRPSWTLGIQILRGQTHESWWEIPAELLHAWRNVANLRTITDIKREGRSQWTLVLRWLPNS